MGVIKSSLPSLSAGWSVYGYDVTGLGGNINIWDKPSDNLYIGSTSAETINSYGTPPADGLIRTIIASSNNVTFNFGDFGGFKAKQGDVITVMSRGGNTIVASWSRYGFNPNSIQVGESTVIAYAPVSIDTATNPIVTLGSFQTISNWGLGIGYAVTATNRSVATGMDGTLATDQSVADGFQASATLYSAAIGAYSFADDESVAFGNSANATLKSTAIGTYSSSNGKKAAIVIGYDGLSKRSYEVFFNTDYVSWPLKKRPHVQTAWWGQTTDATPAEIFLGSESNVRFVLDNNSTVGFNINVIAGVTGAGDTRYWQFKGFIKRGANAASTVIKVNSETDYDAGASAWDCVLSADTTNGALIITVTGQAATTIQWQASAFINERIH